jgi:MscS family membrane protein
MRVRCFGILFASILTLSLLAGQSAQAQQAPPQPAIPPDSLGRESPRGTVLGFLGASRKKDYETARRFLNTTLRGARAETLAQQLAVVLDRRLPARLNQLSARPEGSQYYPDRPDADLVGTINSAEGTADITVQRVDRGKNGVIWLFSKETLDATPKLYEEATTTTVESFVPAFLAERKLAGVTLLQWILILVGMPLVYLLTALGDALISPLALHTWHRLGRSSTARNFHLAPQPIRLLVLVLIIRWTTSHLTLPLLARQFWSGVSTVIGVTALVWLALMLNGWGERRMRERLARKRREGALSILRLVRWTFDLLIVFAGVLILLTYFNLNVTAALAGLGVGGIAIALAAQKTLENVIGGVSIIADRVVRVGGFLKIGDMAGTIEEVGLRSTRIRTADRSVVSIPNGQISNERLEDMSCRDKFWFHPSLSLQYATTATQLRDVLSSVRDLLLKHPQVEPDSIRVRFLRFGVSSLDIDIFAYVCVLDFGDFLAVQEELLLGIMDSIHAAGTRMALPAQTNYVAYPSQPEDDAPAPVRRIPARTSS